MRLQIILGLILAFLFVYLEINSQEDKVSILYNYYSSNNGQIVNSPSMNISKNIFRNTSLEFLYNVDAISSASRNYKDAKTHRNFSRNCSTCHGTIDAITGASINFPEVRNEVGFGIRHTIDESTLGANYKYSKERDYLGQLLSVSLIQDVNNKDTRIYLSYSRLNDKIFPIWNSSTFDKSTDSYDLSVEQVLTSTTISKIGMGFSNSNGLLSNPYSKVNINDLPYSEIHPSTNNKTTVTFMLTQYISDSSISFDYRYYADSWEISGNTIWILYNQYILENLILKPSYRFYTQTAAYFFKEIYNKQENFMTHELSLSKFSSHLIGVSVVYFIAPDVSINTGYSHYIQNSNIDYSKFFQDNDLNSGIFQFGIDYKL